jgi:Mn-dependent DtxR family transcriptional regulator
MSLSQSELELLACLYRKKIIGSAHRRVDAIAGLCHIRTKKGFKKMLRNLTKRGYLNYWHGPAYSLTREGVIAAQKFLGIGGSL